MGCNCASGKLCFDQADRILDQYKTKKGSMITILQKVQESYGYLPGPVMERISKSTGVSESVIFGIVTFYAQFRLEPVGEHLIRVCHGTACHVGGATEITEALQDELDVKNNGTTHDRQFTLESVACLGCCSLAPVMMIDGNTYGKLNPKKSREIVKAMRREAK
ncbi:MAG: NADH-quinone oxidoreductase subunit NuoE [Candidatus Wallbacteria bacterium]|nr:NADH-quinone oxidoreductase subunit NuoE [Candidatus Wallbacteria bacterium]